MNNAAVAALLAVLVFVVLASVCAFPFFNCAKKEMFMGGSGPTVKVIFDYGGRTSGKAYSLNVKHTISGTPKHAVFDYTLLDTRRRGASFKVVFLNPDGQQPREFPFSLATNILRVPFDGKKFQPSAFIISGNDSAPNSNCQYGTYTFTKTPSSVNPAVITGCLPRPGEKMQLSDREVASMKFAARTPRNRILLLDSNGKVKTSVPGNTTLDLRALRELNPSALVLE